jgi:hypothetical protein
VQKECLCILNNIQTYRDDHIRLNSQINEIKDKYKKAQEPFDKMINWKSVYLEPRGALPKYNEKQKLKDQMLFDPWKDILEDIGETQQLATKACKKIWNFFEDLLKECGMQVMQNLNESTPTTMRIT